MGKINVQKGDVWESDNGARAHVQRIEGLAPYCRIVFRNEIKFKARLGLERSAYQDGFTRGRKLVERDGKPMMSPAGNAS